VLANVRPQPPGSPAVIRGFQFGEALTTVAVFAPKNNLVIWVTDPNRRALFEVTPSQ
jgi:hypothetical protein